MILMLHNHDNVATVYLTRITRIYYVLCNKLFYDKIKLPEWLNVYVPVYRIHFHLKLKVGNEMNIITQKSSVYT